MVFIGATADPDDLIRKEWSELLAEALRQAINPAGRVGVNRKQLQQMLANVGIDVSVRATGQWLSGETAPRPSVQAAIAHVLHVPSRALWPLNYAVAA